MFLLSPLLFAVVAPQAGAAAAPQAPAQTPAQERPAAPHVQILVLEGATVHSMIPGEAPRIATVIIEGDRIRSVGLGMEIPAQAERVDLTGKHLIPGLIDGMVNHDPDHDRLYVTAGVTLVRDVGNDLVRILAERDKGHTTGARDRGPGPAIFCAGAVLDGPDPSTKSAVILGSPEEAEAKLARLFELEPDFLSFQPKLAPPVWRKVIELAHAKGLQVWGPKLPALDLARIVEAGQDGIFHLEAFLPAGQNWADVSIDALRPSIQALTSQALGGKAIAITPTLAVFAQRVIIPKDRPVELDFLGPMYVASWLADLGMREEVVKKDAAYQKNGIRVIQIQGEIVKALYERGVKLVPGSAAPNPGLLPGDALVDELSMWVRAGIPAQAALEAATSRAARNLGIASDRGTIEAGKIADLVVLKGDPVADIKALHSPETVVLRGHVLTRAFMDSLRKDLADRQKELQAAAFRPLVVAEPKVPEGEKVLSGTVETRAMGQRVSGESYAVVRLADGSLAYCAHVLTPGSVSIPDTDVEMQETLKDGHVVGFDVEIKTGKRIVSVRGILAAGVLNVERRIDQAFQGNVPVRDPIALVDVGSITAAIALGQQTRVGHLKVLFFDDLDPAVGNWELRLDRDGTHLARTHNGALKVKFAEGGAVAEVQREEGSGIATTKPLSADAKGKGLPLPEKKGE